MRITGLLTCAAALALLACSPSQDGQPPEIAALNNAATVADLGNAFIEGYFAHNPDAAVYAGRHEYDGEMPDMSDEGIARQVAFLEAVIAAAEALDVDGADRLQRDHLLHVARNKLFDLTNPISLSNPINYASALDPSVYITRRYASAEERMQAFITYARNVPEAIGQMRGHLGDTIPASFQYAAGAGLSGYAEFYRGNARAAFAEVEDETLQLELIEATEAAAQAAEEAAEYIGSLEATDDGYALGVEAFQQMILAGEGVDTSLEELEEIGRADLRRNQQALSEACAQFAPGASMGDCMGKMTADKPINGPVAEAREQLPRLRAFVAEQDLVSIPGTEEALVEEAPPYNRQNTAYINIPGPFEEGLASVYYISPPDPNWDEETRNDFIPGKNYLLFISLHEIWPGHFLQFLHSNRSENLFNRVFVSYGLAEGWAHYTEEMMWNAGFGTGDPAVHIGQLSAALQRDCRYLSAIGLHTGGMTVAESQELFRTECYQDEGTARQQAARGTYDPRYLNYTLGKLMIRKLREDWTATRGGREAWKEFHDTFLSYGGMPVPLIRQAMMEEDAPHSVF